MMRKFLAFAGWALAAAALFELRRTRNDCLIAGKTADTINDDRVASIEFHNNLRRSEGSEGDESAVEARSAPKETKGSIPEDMDTNCPGPVSALASGVQHCRDNRFTLPGTWKVDPSLASSKYDDSTVCAPGKNRFFPFFENGHGCCTDHKGQGIPPGAVFWPTAHSKSQLETENNLNLVALLEAVRGRVILFLGDSMTQQMYFGILMALTARSIPFDHTFTTGDNSRHDIFVPSHGAKLRLLSFYQVEDPSDAEADGHEGYFLKEDFLSPYLRQSDIVLANLGLHNWGNPSFQERQMKHIVDLLEKEQEKRTPNNQICFLWRRTLPQHFPTESGTGQWGHRWTNYSEVAQDVGCVPLSQSWEHPSDPAMESVRSLFPTSARGNKTAIVDYTSIFQDASAFHSKNTGDCSHYCYASRIWSPMLLLTAEAIRHTCSLVE